MASWARLVSHSNVWSLVISAAAVLPALLLSIVLSTRRPSSLAYEQEDLHCRTYNNDGTNSTEACLVQWCANESHWPFSWCTTRSNGLPYDPDYNKNRLTAFPNDPASASLAWACFGLLMTSVVTEVVATAILFCCNASRNRGSFHFAFAFAMNALLSLALQLIISVLQHVDPARKREGGHEVSKRFTVLLTTVASSIWFVRVSAAAVLLALSVQVASAWGLYNNPPGLWTASSILLGILLALQVLHRVLRLSRSRYFKGGPDPTGTRAVPPARKLSASRVHDVATPDAVREEGDVAGTAEEQDNSRNLGKGLIDYSWEEVTRATKGFDASMLLGQGGFGKVYKGITATNQTVAIKVIRAHVLSQSTGSSDLKSEVEVVSRVHHRNLVQLAGFSSSRENVALVLEFMENGSLEGQLKGGALDWPHRVRIAIGAARGLSYLHNDCSPRVIHRDIKSSNILLDAAFEAKVADFGLALLLKDQSNHATTRVMGTIGYLAPDYAVSGRVTDKSDVYSFGVVLLELLTGKRPVDLDRSGPQQSLVEWVWQLEESREDPLQLMDPALEGAYDDPEALTMWRVAMSCINPMARYRPGMDEVLRMLSAGRPSTQESINPEHSHALSVASGRLSEEGQSAGPGAKDSGNMKGLQKIYSQLLNRAAEAAVDVDGDVDEEQGSDTASLPVSTGPTTREFWSSEIKRLRNASDKN